MLRRKVADPVALAEARGIEQLAAQQIAQFTETLGERRADPTPARWLAQHAGDLARLAAVRDEQAKRVRGTSQASRYTEPATYLTAELGPRPQRPRQQRTWDFAARDIERFRARWGVIDTECPWC